MGTVTIFLLDRWEYWSSAEKENGDGPYFSEAYAVLKRMKKSNPRR